MHSICKTGEIKSQREVVSFQNRHCHLNCTICHALATHGNPPENVTILSFLFSDRDICVM